MISVVVVGGGIIGASAAYNLAVQGTDVTLYDPTCAGNATGAAAGVINALAHGTKDDSWYTYSFPAMRYYSKLIAELDELGISNHSFRTIGDLAVALDDDGVAELKVKHDTVNRLLERHGNAGIGCSEFLSGAEVRQVCPLVQDAVAGIWHDEVANVDGQRMRSALHDAIRQRGGKVVAHAVQRLVRDGDRISGVIVEGEFVGAEQVVLAAGSWATALARTANLTLDVFPQRGQITHAYLPGAGPTPSIYGRNRHYILSFPGDRFVFGATREDAGFSYETTIGGIDENIREAVALIPRLREAKTIETRVGFRPFTKNSVPHIGKATSVDGLYVGVGISAQGMTLGAYTGAVIAGLITGRESLTLPAEFTPRI